MTLAELGVLEEHLRGTFPPPHVRIEGGTGRGGGVLSLTARRRMIGLPRVELCATLGPEIWFSGEGYHYTALGNKKQQKKRVLSTLYLSQFVHRVSVWFTGRVHLIA